MSRIWTFAGGAENLNEEAFNKRLGSNMVFLTGALIDIDKKSYPTFSAEKLVKPDGSQTSNLTIKMAAPKSGAAMILYLPGLKESFRLTERLNTRCSGEESLLSGQK